MQGRLTFLVTGVDDECTEVDVGRAERVRSDVGCQARGLGLACDARRDGHRPAAGMVTRGRAERRDVQAGDLQGRVARSPEPDTTSERDALRIGRERDAVRGHRLGRDRHGGRTQETPWHAAGRGREQLPERDRRRLAAARQRRRQPVGRALVARCRRVDARAVGAVRALPVEAGVDRVPPVRADLRLGHGDPDRTARSRPAETGRLDPGPRVAGVHGAVGGRVDVGACLHGDRRQRPAGGRVERRGTAERYPQPLAHGSQVRAGVERDVDRSPLEVGRAGRAHRRPVARQLRSLEAQVVAVEPRTELAVVHLDAVERGADEPHVRVDVPAGRVEPAAGDARLGRDPAR